MIPEDISIRRRRTGRKWSESAAAGVVLATTDGPGVEQRRQIYVLEDNLRVPSGVSYVLENRDILADVPARV